MSDRSKPHLVRLDLNNPHFQEQLFDLEKVEQRAVLNTLRKIASMTWSQVYEDPGLKWEVILSRKGPHGDRIYSLRLGRALRAVAYRQENWLRLLSLHPDHDSAYR
jgi:hypothetical protein